jgi:hypothetical protein
VIRTICALAFALGFVAPAGLAAQSANGARTIYYGVSAGLGRRDVSGALQPSALPASAGQPPSRTTAAVDLEAGYGLAKRVGLFAIFDNGAALKDASGWGSIAGDAVVRAWVAERVWVEGGLNLTELGFKPEVVPAVSATLATSRLWRAGFETGGGLELFHGPTVTLHVFVRYAQATFDGLHQRTLTCQIGLLGRH